jgi:phage terminase small subunit
MAKILEELTDKQKKFVEAYFEFSKGTHAAVVAGYAVNSAHVEASRLLKNDKIREYLEELQKERRELIQNRLAGMAEKAAEMLFELAMNAESENVRVNALKDILDRAGYKPTDKVEQKNEHSGKIVFSFCDPSEADE